MSFMNERFTKSVQQRVNWLNARSQVLTSNISNADVRGTLRKEIKPFHEIVNKNHNHSDLKITTKDVITTKSEIAREIEILEFNRNFLEHESVINLLKNFHGLIKIVLNLNQNN